MATVFSLRIITFKKLFEFNPSTLLGAFCGYFSLPKSSPYGPVLEPQLATKCTLTIFKNQIQTASKFYSIFSLTQMKKATTKINFLFRKWVSEYTDTLYSWACYKTSDEQLAQDLVQDTFTAAYEAYANFRQDSNPKTWLISILNNKITDYYRKEGRNPVSNVSSLQVAYDSVLEERFDENGMWKKQYEPKEWPTDTHLLDDREFKLILEHCMAQLPDQWNSAVKMKYLKGKKGKAISQELGISTSNYWQIIHRAKVFLRECLEMLWFKK